jgi:hypothetical protein
VLRWAGAGDGRAVAPWLELRRVLPAVEEFFLSLPPTSDKRLGGYVAVLPILAELDPTFAAQALDRGRLLAAVEDDPALTPEERERQLSVLSSRFYAGGIMQRVGPGPGGPGEQPLPGDSPTPELAGAGRRSLLEWAYAEGICLAPHSWSGGCCLYH